MMRSLRSQLSLSIMLVVLVTVSVISLLANLMVNRQFEEYIIAQEKTRSEDIVEDLSSHYNSLTRTWDHDFLHTIGMYSLYDGYILKIHDKTGRLLWDAENHDMTLCRQIMNDIAERMKRRMNDGGFIAHTYELTHGRQKIGSVTIKYYGPYFFSENDFMFIRTFNVVLLVIGLISCACSFVVGLMLARRITRPITKTAEIAKQIANGNYNIRFEGKTKTRELNNLVSAINSLASALDDQEISRKRLTANLAHELRTPLAAIGSHLEAMVEGLWETTPERLKGCLEEVRRLGNLIADLEHLAKIEGDNLRLKRSAVDLLEIVRAVSNNFEIDAKKKNISLMIEGTPALIRADKDRMRQVITNLLSNAIKYTRDGGHVRLAVKDSETEGIVIVEDDGIGIPEQEHPLIFERFYRTDRSRNRKTGGAGIGLAIVKSIVAAHGGTVSVESQENQGSRFTIKLPKSGQGDPAVQ